MMMMMMGTDRAESRGLDPNLYSDLLLLASHRDDTLRHMISLCNELGLPFSMSTTAPTRFGFHCRRIVTGHNTQTPGFHGPSPTRGSK